MASEDPARAPLPPLLKLCALWKRRNGKPGAEGHLDRLRVLVLPNQKRADHPRDPDYFVYLAPPMPKAEPEPGSSEPSEGGI